MTQRPVLVLTRTEIAKLDPMQECIDALSDGFSQLANGHAQALERTIVQFSSGSGRMALMPGVLEASGSAGIKVQCTVVDPNTRHPAISGIVALHDVRSGSLVAILDSATITEIRTAAASAVATRHLAREDANRLALIGSGAQARAHVAAITCVRNITEISVWSPTEAHVERLRTELERDYRLPVRACQTPEEAMQAADIICVATRATSPVVMRSAVPDGAHLNSVGSYGPTSRELDGNLVQHSHVYVDLLSAVKKECGDVLIPVQEGQIGWEHVRGELGTLVTGRAEGRQHPDDVTLYKAIGTGIADVAAADAIFRKASAQRVGTEIRL